MLEDFCLGNLPGLSFFRKDLMETATCQSDLEEVGPCFFRPCWTFFACRINDSVRSKTVSLHGVGVVCDGRISVSGKSGWGWW